VCPLKILITGGSGFVGTNLVERFLKDTGVTILNIDINPPKNVCHQIYWEKGDVSDYGFVLKVFENFKPHILIHMAARTDLNGNSLEDYSVNIEGVKNIIRCCNLDKNLKRTLFVSSMLVCRLGYQPKNDEDYCPNTFYGESKVIGEELVRTDIRPGLEWSILRPTSLWGPWFDVPYRSFFDAVRLGFFMMPANIKVYRSYGFVLNSVEQIKALIDTDKIGALYKVHYLADHEPIELSDWANEVINFSGKGKIFRPPWIILKMAAKLGDLLKYIGLKSPLLTSFRFKNMTTNAVYDTGSWEDFYSSQRYSMREGVRITVDWMDDCNTNP
jgi:GlcNAc-P-P-Und epimerase